MATRMPVYAPSTTTSVVDAVTAPLFSSDFHHCHTPYAAAFSSQQQQQRCAAVQQMPSSMAAYHSLYHQQQQQMFSSGGVNMMLTSSSVHAQAMGNNVVGAPQQQMMVMQTAGGLSGGHARVGNNNNTNTNNNNSGRSSRSPNNANNGNATSARQPSVPFNPAAAMPLEDMISAYNNVKAREIEMQADYANEVAASAAAATATGLPVVAIPPFVSPFVDYACSQQGKLVLQGLLHFEDEVAVAQDLFTSIGGSVEHIALNEHGCHVIRALGEKIGVAAAVLENEDGTINTEAAAAQNEASLIAFISSLHETLFLNICTLSQESRRIPQALFETYNGTRPELFTTLIEIVARNVLYLSATQQGCIALIRIYEACNFAQKRQIAANLVRIIADLSCDSFGNYVVQCLIEHSEIHVAAQYISSSFVGQCVRLSCNKFASNVLEKAIKKLSHIPSVRKIILDELIFDQANVTLCCEDSYANFVVQTIIETCSNAAEFRKVYDRVKGAIGNSMYAVKIEARLRSKSFFTSTANTSASPSSNPAAVTGGAMQQMISVSVGNAALQQHNNNNKSSSMNSSGIPSPLNATMIGLASTNSSSAAPHHPIYNATTAPSTPMLAASPIDQQQATAFSSVDETAIVGGDANRSSRTVNVSAFFRGADGDASSSTTSPKVQQQQQQRFNSKFSSRGLATTGASRIENEAAKSSAPTSTVISPMNTKETEDTLRAEAKRLLNSDKPPARFTPYKPSPFQQNRNNNNTNNNNVNTNVAAPAAAASTPTSVPTPAPAAAAAPSSPSPLGLKERTTNSINVEKNVPANQHTSSGKKSHNNNKPYNANPHKDRSNTANKNNGSSPAAAAADTTNNSASQSSSPNSSPSPARHQNGHGNKNKNFKSEKDTNKSPRAGSDNSNNHSAPRRNKTRASHTEVACHH